MYILGFICHLSVRSITERHHVLMPQTFIHHSLTDGNELVSSRKRIMRHYLLSWFAVDFVSVLPLNVTFYLISPVFNWIRSVTLNKNRCNFCSTGSFAS